MKKLMLSVAVMGFLAFATVQAQTQRPTTTNPEATAQERSNQERSNKVQPEDLPEKVREAIENHDEVKGLKINEANHMVEENKAYYVVKFESKEEGEEVKKKFDVMGEEVKGKDSKKLMEKEPRL